MNSAHMHAGMAGIHQSYAYRIPTPHAGLHGPTAAAGPAPHPALIPPEYLGYNAALARQAPPMGRPRVSPGAPPQPGVSSRVQSPTAPQPAARAGARPDHHSPGYYSRHSSVAHPAYPSGITGPVSGGRPLHSTPEHSLASPQHHRHLSPQRHVVNRSHSLERPLARSDSMSVTDIRQLYQPQAYRNHAVPAPQKSPTAQTSSHQERTPERYRPAADVRYASPGSRRPVAPSPVNFPAKRSHDAPANGELPLDLSVKRSRVDGADNDSDDDVIVLGVQGPQNVNTRYPPPPRVTANGGNGDLRRPHSEWNFPQQQGSPYQKVSDRRGSGDANHAIVKPPRSSVQADKQAVAAASAKPASHVSLTAAQYRQSPDDNYRRHSASNITSERHRLPPQQPAASGRFYTYSSGRTGDAIQYETSAVPQMGDRSARRYPSPYSLSPTERERRTDRSPIARDRPRPPSADRAVYSPDKSATLANSDIPVSVPDGTLLFHMLEQNKNKNLADTIRKEIPRQLWGAVSAAAAAAAAAAPAVDPAMQHENSPVKYARSEERSKMSPGRAAHYMEGHCSKQVSPGSSYNKPSFSQSSPAINKSPPSSAPFKKDVTSAETLKYGDGLPNRESSVRESRDDAHHPPSQIASAALKGNELRPGGHRVRDERMPAWSSWKTSTLSIAESPVRLSTLMEPVSVSRRRNDGYLGDKSSPVSPETASRDVNAREPPPPCGENNTAATPGLLKKHDTPIRSKKEYIFAHLQRDQGDCDDSSALAAAKPKAASIPLGQETQKSTSDETGALPGSNNNNSNKSDYIGSRGDGDTNAARAPVAYTPVAYLQNRVIAEVIEQTHNEVKLPPKDETWPKPSNPEYFPRGAPLELSSIKRIPVANVQPIVKDKKNDTDAVAKTSQSWMSFKKDSDKNAAPNRESSKLAAEPTLREARACGQTPETCRPDDTSSAVNQQREFVKFFCSDESQSIAKEQSPIVVSPPLDTPGHSTEAKFDFHPYRTPTSLSKSDIDSQGAAASDNNASGARKKLSLHFSTPKGRHKLYFQDPDESNSGSQASSVSGETGNDLKTSAFCDDDNYKVWASNPLKSETSAVTNCSIQRNKSGPNEADRKQADSVDRLGKTALKVGTSKNKSTTEKPVPRKKKSLLGAVKEGSLQEKKIRTRRVRHNDVSGPEGNQHSRRDSARARKYPKRRQEKRQPRSSRLRRALRSARKSISYNKNSAYEEELRKEEERKLLRRVQKHAQIRKTLRHLDDGLGAGSQLDPIDSPVSGSADEEGEPEESVPVEPHKVTSSPKPTKSTLRRFRRRRKDYFDTDRRAKQKRLQKLREKRQDGESHPGLCEPGASSTPLPGKSDDEDADERSAELGLETRTGSVHDEGTSTDQTTAAATAPDAKKLVVCKETGETILHKAARLGYNEIALSSMSCENVDVNVRDNAGYTPLHESCASGNVRIASWLIQRRADVNAKAFDGTRPLHDAVGNDYIEIARLLLAHGGDPTIANYSGKTPKQFSRSARMTSFLEGYFSDLNSGTEPGARWEFSKRFYNAEERCPEIDVLADAPADSEDESASDEIEFEFCSRPPLPLYRVLVDKNKGPRNYHLVTDIASSMGMMPDDFIILNNDLSIVSVPAAVLKEASTLATTENRVDEERRIHLVELDHILRQMLDITVETASNCEIHHKIRGEIGGNGRSQTTGQAVKTGENCDTSRVSANDISPAETTGNSNTASNLLQPSERAHAFKPIKRGKSRNREDCADPSGTTAVKREGSPDNAALPSSTNKIERSSVKQELFTGKRCHNSLSNGAKAKVNEARQPGHASYSSPLAILSELSCYPYSNTTIRDVIHKLRAVKLEESGSEPAGKGKPEKPRSPGQVLVLSFGLTVSKTTSSAASKPSRRSADSARAIVEPARFQYSAHIAINKSGSVLGEESRQKEGGLDAESPAETPVTVAGETPTAEARATDVSANKGAPKVVGAKTERRAKAGGSEGQGAEGGDPALPVLEKLEIDDTSSETTEVGSATEDREMPQLTLCAY